MSDATDDLDFWGRQLLRRSQSNPLRERMRAFVAETDLSVPLKELRSQVGNGVDLADIVDEGRDERV